MTAPAGAHRPPDPGIDVDNPLDDYVGAMQNETDGHIATPRESIPDENFTRHPLQPNGSAVVKNEELPDRNYGWSAGSNGDVAAFDDSPEEKKKQDTVAPRASEEQDQQQQDREKQSAATSLLAQLLGNAPSTGTSAPDNGPRTPLPEPLTDVSTDPGGPHDEPSMTEADAPPAGNSDVHPQSVDQAESVNNAQDQHALPADHSMGPSMEDGSSTKIPNMVLGVMEDPLSKTSHEPNGLFAPFDAEGGPKNGFDALQQHDVLANPFLAQSIDLSGLSEIPGYPNPISYPETATSIAGSEPRIQAFAKLEFDDGHFYVNTYSFILGRDVRAARAAYQREVQVRQAMGRPSKNKSSSGGNTSHTPNRVKREGSAIMGSVVSDRGGIMGFDPDIPHPLAPQMSRKSSISSHGDPALHATPAQLQANHTDYNALAMQSLHEGNGDAKPVDTLALLPSPDACPTIPIHPPATADGSAAGHKGISRKHVRIAYNYDKNLFEMEVIGRNGAFIGADWLAPGQVRPLHSGDYIQIGGVRIRFLLPDVPIGETGADRVEESFMDEDESALAGGGVFGDATVDADGMDLSGPDGADGTDQTKSGLRTMDPDASNLSPSVEGGSENPQHKRRGPGRPPKDGIMSKRERAEIAREQKMAAKREANGGVTPPPPAKIKPPKPPRKEDSVEEAVKPDKRKFTKRKQSDGTIVDVPIQSIEGGELPAEQVVEYPKPPAVKKRKPSKSPSPDYPPESSYTQEEMTKPPYNYAVLIFDALTESRTPMTLKQIYRALKMKYPYFRFKCETEGWTSSVRHNLNGNRHLFEHAERDGKGWSWQLCAGASVEKEKKRRPSPPPPPPPSHLSHAPPGVSLPPHQHYMAPPSHPYINQGPPPSHSQPQHFQFSSIPPNSYHAPTLPTPPVPPPSNHYQPPPPPQAQGSLSAPEQSTNLPAAFTQPGKSMYTSPYPCEPPPEIVHLQPQGPPPPNMSPSRSAESVPPPRQDHQNLQPYIHHTPSPFPMPNNQIQHGPPPAQAPPPQSQPSQPLQPQPQPYPNSMQSTPAPPEHSIMDGDEDPDSSMSFTERANKAIDDFEAVLMEDYDDKNYIREVLKSARARALGHAEESSFPGGEPKDEAVLLDVLRNLIGSLKEE